MTSRLCNILLGCGVLLIASSGGAPQHNQSVTPAPKGPFHIEKNQIIDGQGKPYLLRGTQLAEFNLKAVPYNTRGGDDFGSHSATTLAAIRLRFNMNTVRVPLEVPEQLNDAYFTELSKVVRRINEMELLPILVAHETGAALPTPKTVDFWKRTAAHFKNEPTLMFDAFADPQPSGDAHSAEGWDQWRSSMNQVVTAIRSTGARQPIVVMSWKDGRLFEGATTLLDDPNVIYEAAPSYRTSGTDAGRDAHFGFLAERVPVLAAAWDVSLDNAAECAVIPTDPGEATRLVQQTLRYFDTRGISWTASAFEPGKLIRDLSFHDATSLENGWTCGEKVYPAPGMGRLLQAHLRESKERGLFVVSAAGGVDLPRGGFANAYGPVMANRDSISNATVLPRKLGGVSVEVTDSQGVTRNAGIFWASAGWGQTNFVVPPESATGRALMSVVREDGSRESTNIIIGDTVPGFRTGLSCRGPASGYAFQTFADGHSKVSPISDCKGYDCKTILIPNTPGTKLQVRLVASGFRNMKAPSELRMTLDGKPIHVVSVIPSTSEPGMDLVTIEIPSAMRSSGEVDVIAHINGRVSNPVRIKLGA